MICCGKVVNTDNPLFDYCITQYKQYNGVNRTATFHFADTGNNLVTTHLIVESLGSNFNGCTIVVHDTMYSGVKPKLPA